MSTTQTHSPPLADRPRTVILIPEDPTDLATTRRLFEEYAQALGIDLCFQNFDEELSTLPGDYAPPHGALLLALVEMPADAAPPESTSPFVTRTQDRLIHAAGCCALRPLNTTDYPNAAEMKRLYVRPAFRSLGLGRQLAEAILDTARHAGYSCVLLDTLDDMEAARDLYEDLGFAEVPPYYHNPVAGAHYLKVDL